MERRVRQGAGLSQAPEQSYRDPNRRELVQVRIAAAIGPSGALAADLAAADIVEAGGTFIGRAAFEQTPTGILIFVEAEGLPPGAHGIHPHGTGACAPDFKAAGGRINPAGAKHCLRHPEGPDNGDPPNLYVAADGTARAEFFTTRVTVGGRRPARAPGRGRLGGRRPRSAGRPPDPADRRRGRTHRVRGHREEVAPARVLRRRVCGPSGRPAASVSPMSGLRDPWRRRPVGA